MGLGEHAVQEVTMNAYLAVIASIVTCQFTKLFLHYSEYNKLNVWVLLEDGGMPSTHATALAAVATVVGLTEGFSLLFLSTTIVTLVILSELMKVKRDSAMRSEHLLRFIDLREIIRRKLSEGTPHTPETVFCGVLHGVIVSALIFSI